MIKASDILIPNKNINLNKWSVIACDQFSSNCSYWINLKKYIGNEPSALDLILPECFISHNNGNEYFKIKDNSKFFLENDTFQELRNSMVFVKRAVSSGKIRKGIIFSIDLEEYSFTDKNAKIRPSELTLVDRLNVRKDIRANSFLELPHALLLYNDSDNKLINLIEKEKLTKIYDFTLNCGGGLIQGYQVENCKIIIDFFNNLKEQSGPVFIVGDGNHSIAAAKLVWEEMKKNLSLEEIDNHPARFMLVEAVNIFDDGLEFFPIHRVIFDSEGKIINELEKLCGAGYINVYKNNSLLTLSCPLNEINLYKVISKIIELNLNKNVDFIHDKNFALKICQSNPEAIFLEMPTIPKEKIFDYVSKGNVLPKKSFSIGKTEDKRYYLEARRIVK